MAKEAVKLAELQVIMAREEPELVLLTEPHLEAHHLDPEVTPPGYTVHRVDREGVGLEPGLQLPIPPGLSKSAEGKLRNALARRQRRRKGGGVLLFARQGRTILNVAQSRGDDHELLAFDDEGSGRRFVLVYRRPGPAVSKELLDALAEQTQGCKNVVVMGDLNMNMRAKVPQPRQLHTMLRQQLGLTQQVRFVTRPPRGGRGSGTVIDHVWTAGPCRCTHIPEVSHLSDHLLLRVNLPSVSASQAPRRGMVWRRRWDRLDPERLEGILREEMPPAPHGAGHGGGLAGRGVFDPAAPRCWRAGRAIRRAHGEEAPAQADEAASGEDLERWERAWRRVKDELVPRVRSRARKAPLKYPWLRGAPLEAMQRRNRLRRRARAPGAGPPERAAYKAACTQALAVQRSARRRWIRERWRRCGPGALRSEHWRFLNGTMGRKVKCRDEPRASPDAVNAAFLGKVERIRRPMEREPGPEIAEMLGGQHLATFEPVTEAEVRATLGKVRATRSTGEDEVPMAIIKQHWGILAP